MILGEIVDILARMQAIVDNWPAAVDGTRAVALGLPHASSLKRLVEEYLGDFGPGGGVRFEAS